MIDFKNEYILYYNDKKFTFPRTISVYEAIELMKKWNKPKVLHLFGRDRQCLHCGVYEKMAKLKKTECKQL